MLGVFVVWNALKQDHFTPSATLDPIIISDHHHDHDCNETREHEPSFQVQDSSKIANLPEVYLDKNRKIPVKVNKDCHHYPPLWSLRFSNQYWQVYENQSEISYLFGAYYDKRRNQDMKNMKSIRILLMTRSVRPGRPFCQIWFNNNTENKEPLFSKVTFSRQVSSFGSGVQYLTPHLLACPLPTSHQHLIPASVSLVNSTNCTLATNNLKVNYNIPTKTEPKQLFGVCMKALTIVEDQSHQIIEWIELLRVLGASKVLFYILHVHENILKVTEENEQFYLLMN